MSLTRGTIYITAALNRNAGITIGNIVGSNILNILIILGITAVITNVAIQKSTLFYEIPFMIGITVLLMIFGITDSKVTLIEGVIFWILFIMKVSEGSLSLDTIFFVLFLWSFSHYEKISKENYFTCTWRVYFLPFTHGRRNSS